jgi:hypothetical protein
MAPVVKTAWLAASVARLTGDPGRGASEGKRYRLPITTANGHKHAVSVQVDTHPTDARPYALNQIADAFKVDRPDILSVLNDWTPEQLKAHLEQFQKADLMPPTYRS